MPSLGGMRTVPGVTHTFECFVPRSSEGGEQGLHVCVKRPGQQRPPSRTSSCNSNESAPPEEMSHEMSFPSETGGLFPCHDFRQLRNLCRLVMAQMGTDTEICSRLHA